MTNDAQGFVDPASIQAENLSQFELVNPSELVAEELLTEIFEGETVLGEIDGDQSETIESQPEYDAAQPIHELAAEEAQTRADAAIEVGDYESAAVLREAAEVEAELAGNDDMLHGSDLIDLEAAAGRQQEVEQLEWQESQHAQNGDYEAARDDAFEAEWVQKDADALAGGSDHSGQPQLEFDQMDWAVWHEEIAEEHSENAIEHLENGNLDAAQNDVDLASSHQEMADWHGDLGEHAGPLSLDDPCSETANDHGFDHGFDSGFDAGIDSTDGYTEY